MTTKQKAYIALSATSTIWGTTWVAMKIGVQTMPALQLAAIRLFIAGLLLTSFFIIRGKQLPTLKQLKQLFIFSLFTFVFANGLATFSLQYISSGLAALISALYPLSVVIIEYLFYKKREINAQSLLGILLGFAGIVIIFYENAFTTLPPNYWLGVFISFIAMISWSYSTILISKNNVGIDSYVGMGWQMLFGSMVVFVMSYFSKKNVPISTIPIKAWFAIGYLIAAGSIVSLVAFIYTMKYLPTTIASLYAYINPIVAIFIGSFLLGEHLTFAIIIGTIITLLGVYLVKTSMQKKASTK